MLDKLNTNSSIYLVLPEILIELCDYLNFGCGFYYQANYEKIFIRKEVSAVYEGIDIPESIQLLSLLDSDEADDLITDRYLFYRESVVSEKKTAGEKLAAIFNAKSLILAPINDETNQIIGFVGVSDRRGNVRAEKDDITLAYTIISTLCNYLKLEIIKERLDSTKNALQSVTDKMGVDIYVNDFYTHEILYANASMAEPYGGVDKMVGEVCWKILYDDQNEQCEYCPQKKIVDENGNPAKIYSWDYKRPFDGSWFKVLSSAFEWIDGRLAHIVSSIDITENKKNEEIIQKMALYDHLTGLPNRYRLTEDLEKKVNGSNQSFEEYFIIFFDLDGFKQINDCFGHQAGDDLLVRIGELLRGNEYINDNCYRYGGDEFVIICKDKSITALDYILSYLDTIFSRSILLNEKELKCGASIGISHYPLDDNKTSELIRKADMAMYTSKEKGKGMVHFFNKGNICTRDNYSSK